MEVQNATLKMLRSLWKIVKRMLSITRLTWLCRDLCSRDWDTRSVRANHRTDHCRWNRVGSRIYCGVSDRVCIGTRRAGATSIRCLKCLQSADALKHSHKAP